MGHPTPPPSSDGSLEHLLNPLLPSSPAPHGVIDNEPFSYFWAADEVFGHLYDRLQSELDSLAGVLKGSAGMAGSDKAAKSWAAAYDPAVGGAVGGDGAMEAASACINTAGSFHDMLHATGANYSNADHQSAIDAAHQPAVPPGSKPIYRIPNIPKALGGGSGAPSWWSLISAYVQGEVWPNGHQDKLRAAGAAWKKAGNGFIMRAAFVDGAVTKLREQKAPEIDDAVAAFTDFKQQIFDTGTNFNALGDACEAYAAAIDEAHHKILSELMTLGVMTAGVELLAVLAGLATGFLGTGAMQGVEAGRLTIAGARIAEIIRAFATEVEALGMFGPQAARAFAGASSKLRPWINAPVITAGMEGVNGTKTIAEIQKGFRRPYMRKSTEAGIFAKTDVVTINGEKYYVSETNRQILMPVDKVYHDSSITQLERGGPNNQFFVDKTTGYMYPVSGKWEFGHQYGNEWWRMREMAEREGWTQAQLNDYANNPEFYRIEDRYTNRSHAEEMPREGQ